MHWQKDTFTISDEQAHLNISFIHDFLSQSYWAKEIPQTTVERSIKNSVCFGLYHHQHQIGFCRVITDHATFAYLADVFVIEAFHNQGLGKWLISCVLEHPDLQGLRRWMLATLDAHWLYEKHDFVALKHPEWFMEIAKPELYQEEKMHAKIARDK